MGFNFHYIKTPSGILKVTEIIFVLVALSIMRAGNLVMTAGLSVDAAYFGIGAMVSCLIITPLFLIVYLMGNMDIQKKTIMEICVNFVMAGLLFTFGGLTMDYYTEDYRINPSKGIAMASFSLMAAIVYLADCIVAAMAFKH